MIKAVWNIDTASERQSSHRANARYRHEQLTGSILLRDADDHLVHRRQDTQPIFICFQERFGHGEKLGVVYRLPHTASIERILAATGSDAKGL
jgi:hypothetical protein